MLRGDATIAFAGVSNDWRSPIGQYQFSCFRRLKTSMQEFSRHSAIGNRQSAIPIARLDTTRRHPYTPSLALGTKLLTEASKRVRAIALNQHFWEISMPNHKSAEKRMRQNEKRKQINRSNRTRVRSSIRKLRGALEGDGDAANLLPQTVSTIDKAVQKGVLHKNTAARYKSRLTARVNQATSK